ncbi:MAG TPA: hypothetical protein PLP89_07820 [Synergistales bacterium]|jgi:hypothetical protein|nr:hypothetical protein [Synergistales bacterium]HRV72053.1 hypothetical protein [Thermovirgaceae bacterium]
MKGKFLLMVLVALLLFPLPCALAAECPPEKPDAEPLFETEGIFVGKLDGNLVIFLDNRDGDRQVSFTLDREQASRLFSYAVEARNAAPGMNPFAPTGNMEVPKKQRPMEPLMLETPEGSALWAHVAGRDYRNSSFFADFVLAPSDSGGSPDRNYMQAMTIYETAPTFPKEEIIDKATGQPIGEPAQPEAKWGDEFSAFLSALQKFTGSKLLIIG